MVRYFLDQKLRKIFTFSNFSISKNFQKFSKLLEKSRKYFRLKPPIWSDIFWTKNLEKFSHFQIFWFPKISKNFQSCWKNQGNIFALNLPYGPIFFGPKTLKNCEKFSKLMEKSRKIFRPLTSHMVRYFFGPKTLKNFRIFRFFDFPKYPKIQKVAGKSEKYFRL